MGTSGLRPLVTAWEITACRFSLSSFDQPLLLGNQPVYPSCFVVEEGGDDVLLINWR